jgi:hypothetical protein
MRLSAQDFGVLVQKAFVLEAIADKPGCTTRYKDLEGKPLEDFIIAGLNVGPSFEAFAKRWLDDPKENEIFSHQLRALKVSTTHKSAKFISMGLLELMFPFVAARIRCDDPGKVIDVAHDLLAQAPRADVEHLIEVRKYGWARSKNKEAKLKELKTDVVESKNPGEFYTRFLNHQELVPAAYQWGKHYADKHPFIRQQFEYLQNSSGPLLDRIREAFIPMQKENPDIKIGILADASAVAIFLHLSFIE